MADPVIDPTTSILSFPQWQTWEHYFVATNSPYAWTVVSGGFPSGMIFQPNWNGIGDHTTGAIDTGVDHGLAIGDPVVFSSITWSGGTGLAVNTLYFVSAVPSSSEIMVAATPGGASLSFTADFVVSNLFRPGYLSGAADTPGISSVSLVATNGSGSSAEVVFTIGIEAAAATPDSNADLIWDFATNSIIAQSSSTVNLTPADRATPILFVKEGDDLITRLRMVKAGSVLDLQPLADPSDLKLVLKELEPEGQVVVSDTAQQIGTGDANSYVIHSLIDGAALQSSLSNYEADTGTFYNALAEIEITFPSPFIGWGPTTLHRTSKTFCIQIERDLGAF